MRETAAVIAFERILLCSLVTHSQCLDLQPPDATRFAFRDRRRRSDELAPRFKYGN